MDDGVCVSTSPISRLLPPSPGPTGHKERKVRSHIGLFAPPAREWRFRGFWEWRNGGMEMREINDDGWMLLHAPTKGYRLVLRGLWITGPPSISNVASPYYILFALSLL